jgi:hypothetical protein
VAPAETQALQEIKAQLEEHRADFRVFATSIMGTDDGEVPSGRLPVLESKSTNHEKRITRIEHVLLMVAGAGILLKFLAMGVDSLAHVVQVLKGAN